MEDIMKKNYYTKAKLAQIIMDLIYLRLEIDKDGHTDNFTLKHIQEVIDELKYYYQFL